MARAAACQAKPVRPVRAPPRLLFSGVDGYGGCGLLLRATKRRSAGLVSPFLDFSKDGANRYRGAILGIDSGKNPRRGGRHLDGYLVGLQLHQRLIHGHRVTGLLEPFADRGLGYRLAQRRDADFSHGVTLYGIGPRRSEKTNESQRRAVICRRPTDLRSFERLIQKRLELCEMTAH